MAEQIVKVTGMEEVQKFLGRLRNSKQFFKRTLERICIIVEGSAKQLAPVDTGRLRSSITHEVQQRGKKFVGVVGSPVEYAKFQEMGTKPHFAPVGVWAERHGFPKGTRVIKVSGKARPFLRPAYERNFNRITTYFAGEVKKLITQGGTA